MDLSSLPLSQRFKLLGATRLSRTSWKSQALLLQKHVVALVAVQDETFAWWVKVDIKEDGSVQLMRPLLETAVLPEEEVQRLLDEADRRYREALEEEQPEVTP